MEKVPLPVLIYDGECEFCVRWVKRVTSKLRVEIRREPFQNAVVLEQFGVKREDAEKAVQWIDESGVRFQGAEAVFQVLLLHRSNGMQEFAKIGLTKPMLRLAETVYRSIERNRGWALKVDRFFFGASR
ncbi:MAG: DCC1-like thiol-disulfide oxidoreductase family protein [Bdellovibrionota bacterium]